MGISRLYKKIALLLDGCRGESPSCNERMEKTINLATLLLELTQLETQRKEQKQLEKLSKMVRDPLGKEFLTAMTDQCFRSPSVRRTASQLTYLLRRYGIPRFLPPFDRLKLLFFKYLGTLLPHLFVHLAQKKVRDEVSGVLLPNDSKLQKQYLEESLQSDIRLNLNHLGEAI